MNFDNLKNHMDRIISDYNTPGAECIVYKDHEMLFRYCVGKSDIENNRPTTSDDLYLIFSMTKMLTCTCALQLFEKGLFSLNDPISKYLPEYKKMRVSGSRLNTANAAAIASGTASGEDVEVSGDGYAENPITIKHLFTMTAGLDYDLNAPGIKASIAEGKTTTRDLVRAMSETVLGFEPGTRYRYSLCHDVIGGLVEVLSGKTLGEYMEENIFRPLGMKNTFFGLPTDSERLSRMAALYRFNQDREPERSELLCPYTLTNDYHSGGAGLTSCTEDYALFLDALACGGTGKNGAKILSPATVELMGTNHLSGQTLADFNNMRPGYGYGLGVRTHINKAESGSLSPIGEFGWDGAAGSFSMVDTKNALSITYFQHALGWDINTHIQLRNALYSCF